MPKLIFASKNSGKVKEFRAFLAPKGVEVLSLLDFKDVPEINENGTTFEENSTIKAKTIMDAYDLPVVAEDAGLVVDALNGEPGIYSARYAGDHNDAANNEKLLNNLKDVPAEQRQAHFVAVIVALKPDGEKLVTQGSVEGRILDAPRGKDGFGYDPLFYYEPMQKTLAEMTVDEKNAISHRGKALDKFAEQFNTWWEA
ncbi:XTP/dITP diphosphohydrolase [Weissella uvarum]|uniref:XTP/dITP diphosphatase n=1 Tax=Weissella uvarum TaxID=1479233 RepID=UPI001962211C|nr:XTP/dITP diphosphatase [Weissella uvarum]MBM7617584.1 XTP/dITP diphosphohydrolase [Weissella uvarum]MCM0595534.1 XTP/dITP diphosphatase [Weissella uvarum]